MQNGLLTEKEFRYGKVLESTNNGGTTLNDRKHSSYTCIFICILDHNETYMSMCTYRQQSTKGAQRKSISDYYHITAMLDVSKTCNLFSFFSCVAFNRFLLCKLQKRIWEIEQPIYPAILSSLHMPGRKTILHFWCFSFFLDVHEYHLLHF